MTISDNQLITMSEKPFYRIFPGSYYVGRIFVEQLEAMEATDACGVGRFRLDNLKCIAKGAGVAKGRTTNSKGN